MPRRSVFLALLVLGALARADDRNVKAPTPGHGVILLKSAWESYLQARREGKPADPETIALRYAEPGASFVRSDLAALKTLELARGELGKVVREKLGAGAERELVPNEERITSPLADASVTLCPNGERIKGDRATTHFRVAPGPKEDGQRTGGERYFRFVHVRAVDGDWKVVLSTTDGVPLDAKALEHVAAGTQAHEKAAQALLDVAREVQSGNLGGKDAIRKRILQVYADERHAIEGDKQVERKDEGHEND